MNDISAAVLQQKPWRTVVDKCTDAPWGFLGQGEGHLLYYLARDYYSGDGAIIDAGSFLGRSAWFLARGLEANPRLMEPVGHRVHCFDNFLINEPLTSLRIFEQFRLDLPLGASTRHLFDSATGPIAHWLDVHEGDFQFYPWTPRPIEILFVDIAKTASLQRRLMEVMFPCLIPGRSIVVQQDYHHPWLPHIHVAMEYLHEYFELVEPQIDYSAVFLCTRPIPEGALRVAARSIEGLSSNESLALMDRAIARLPRDCRLHVELTRTCLIGRQQGFEAMRAALEAVDVLAGSGKGDSVWQGSRADMAALLEEIRLSHAWRLLESGRVTDAMEMAGTVRSDDPRYRDAQLLSAYCVRLQQRSRRESLTAQETNSALSHIEVWRRIEQAQNQLRRDPDLSEDVRARSIEYVRILVAAPYSKDLLDADTARNVDALTVGRISDVRDLQAALLALESFQLGYESPSEHDALSRRLELVKAALVPERIPGILNSMIDSTIVRIHAFVVTASDQHFAAGLGGI